MTKYDENRLQGEIKFYGAEPGGATKLELLKKLAKLMREHKISFAKLFWSPDFSEEEERDGGKRKEKR